MFEALKKLFSVQKTDYAQLLSQGAIIVDVRTSAEFSSGHIRGSVNIPLHKLNDHLNKLKSKSTPIITCCASGARSASALSFLRSKGYSQVYNGGSWMRLRNKIS